MEKKEKINILVIVAVIVLIFLIGVFLLVKPFISKKNDSKAKLSADSALIEDLKRAKKIECEDLRKKILLEKDTVAVIDIRDEVSFTEEHIPDSVNIPYPNIQQALASLDKNKTYILVDDGASLLAAYIAGGIFDKSSFPNVFYLNGGFVAWKNKVNLTVSAGDPTSIVDQSKITYINSEGLKKIIESENNLYIIDVREKSQFDAGRIGSATNIFLNDLEKERSAIPSGKKIILYDEDGFMAFQAGVRLYDLGFFNVRVLSDGLKTWREKGYEIVKQ